MYVDHSIPTFLYGEKWWRVLTTRMQESRVDQWDRICIGVIKDHSTGALLAEDGLKRMAVKEIRRIKEMRPKVSSHLNILYYYNFNYQNTEAQKALIDKNAKRQSCWSTSGALVPLPRLYRVGLSNCKLIISAIIPPLVWSSKKRMWIWRFYNEK